MSITKTSTILQVGTRGKSRRGRNPSIDMEKIENAVREIGHNGADISMKEVADHLGVNVTTLYRHVGGIDGLRRIRASLSRNDLDPLPSPDGHNWQSWLRVLSEYYRRALIQHPDLLHFVQAALDPDFVNLEQEASILVNFGFEPRAALLAHSFLITTITGYVQQELQTIEEARAGYAPYYARLFQNLDSQPERLPTLSKVNLSQKDIDRDLNFKSVVNYAIAGIAAQKGAPDIKK
ncbi:MAG TPA: TetR/AcrR family transcriptional regulator C-terminal domain-containing protein [Pseudomonadales bacterium]|nr:TetR/AcrR family transcriptional regulator C-terminal domain-containing protein [Pseudomonadales bacterium]